VFALVANGKTVEVTLSLDQDMVAIRFRSIGG